MLHFDKYTSRLILLSRGYLNKLFSRIVHQLTSTKGNRTARKWEIIFDVSMNFILMNNAECRKDSEIRAHIRIRIFNRIFSYVFRVVFIRLGKYQQKKYLLEIRLRCHGDIWAIGIDEM